MLRSFINSFSAGNIVRYASSGQDEAALIAEARAHGIGRVVIAENGEIREVRVVPPAEQRLPNPSFKPEQG
jgi:hypothetical protein